MSDRSSSTSMVSGLGWGVSLLVVLGLVAHRISQPAATKGSATAEPASKATAEAGGAGHPSKLAVSLEFPARTPKPTSPKYVRPIAQFLGTTIEELCDEQSASTALPSAGGPHETEAYDALSWAKRWGPRLIDYNPEFLIAMLPDPDRSRSAFRFDLWIEALQRAASAHDPGNPAATYVLEHYYLPWKNAGTDQAYDPEAACNVPGVLLFRSVVRNDEPRRLSPPDRRPSERVLIVFRIGDAPIGGIHKRALQTALDIVSWFKKQPIADGTLPRTLRIVGPVFSGSQHSLQLALQTWWTRRKDFLLPGAVNGELFIHAA